MDDKTKALLEEIKQFDTPSVTNVVATYPAKDYCLGLYHPWEGKWYTDQTLRCIYPELGPRVGYVVTAVYGLPDPGYKGHSIADVLRAIDASPKPVILAIKQDFPDHIKKVNGLSGGNMTSAFVSAGVTGVLSDGPSRDIDEIRPMGIQYMLTGVCAGHGPFTVRAVNVPVEICSMEVMPGDIVHMDENGAVKFPADKLETVVERLHSLRDAEAKKQKMLQSTSDVEELIKIMQGVYD